MALILPQKHQSLVSLKSFPGTPRNLHNNLKLACSSDQAPKGYGEIVRNILHADIEVTCQLKRYYSQNARKCMYRINNG